MVIIVGLGPSGLGPSNRDTPKGNKPWIMFGDPFGIQTTKRPKATMITISISWNMIPNL